MFIWPLSRITLFDQTRPTMTQVLKVVPTTEANNVKQRGNRKGRAVTWELIGRTWTPHKRDHHSMSNHDRRQLSSSFTTSKVCSKFVHTFNHYLRDWFEVCASARQGLKVGSTHQQVAPNPRLRISHQTKHSHRYGRGIKWPFQISSLIYKEQRPSTWPRIFSRLQTTF